jgi:GR25 family glycosyltransferase involved in LPS biosynthesis
VTGPRGDFPYSCHVISLDRTPARYESFLRNNRQSRLTFERFSASDGNLFSDADAVASGLIKKGTTWRTRGTLGVAESHRRVWQHVIASGRPALVLEDDVYIRDDFVAVAVPALASRPGWDIALCSYNADALVEFNIGGDFDLSALHSVRHPTEKQVAAFARSSPPTALFPLRHAFGTSGYFISPAGAEKLLRRCFPMDNRVVEFRAAGNRFDAFSLDSMMNVFYRVLSAHIFVAPLAMPVNDWRTSTVDPRKR